MLDRMPAVGLAVESVVGPAAEFAVDPAVDPAVGSAGSLLI